MEMLFSVEMTHKIDSSYLCQLKLVCLLVYGQFEKSAEVYVHFRDWFQVWEGGGCGKIEYQAGRKWGKTFVKIQYIMQNKYYI